jgi:farnesyl diphosphate synthase
VISIAEALKEAATLTESVMERLIPEGKGPEAKLLKAMRYSSFSGGKRLRPFIVLTCSDLFDVPRQCSQRVAAAVEMAHTYSLVHDDLPAMDNDELRRGKPTCHIKFDEATAILAGDGLLTLAFEVLSDEATYGNPEVRCELISELAKAIGVRGMVGGQMLDLLGEKEIFDVPEIARLQRMKTGALIGFSCQAGAILGRASKNQKHMLNAFAHDLGLAFQIVDDLLDVEGTVEELGKEVRKDEGAGKATFVSLLGVERAREQAIILSTQAIKHLEIFGEKGDLLKNLVQFMLERRN